MSQQSSLPTQINYLPAPRTPVRRAFKVLLFFVGIFIAEFGFLGAALTVSGSNRQIGYSVFVIGLLALLGSIFIFFRTRYKARCLSWLQYFWWILGATIGVIMAIAPDFAFVPNDKVLPTAIFGCITLLYGIALAGIAHLIPSLRQQVKESVRRILKSIPSKQMAVTDLVTLLRKEYPSSETTLYQFIGDFNDIEHMTIPGIPVTLCRIKGTQETIAFPQVHGINTYHLRQSVSRAVTFLTEENADIGLYLLSKDFEKALKTYLVTANAKGKLSTTPGGKSPEKLTLTEMVSCVKNNGIITNDAALSYLRQARNDRAHRTMPSLTERQLLMKSMQYIACLYIDYIKLLDDLTYSLSFE